MNVLIVGAGAVGQVYGYHLQQGGAEVTFLLKEKYWESAKNGFTLFPLNRRKSPLHWQSYDLVTKADEIAEKHWDQCWLAISSPALGGPWLKEVLNAIGHGTVVSLLPGLKDAELLGELVPAKRLVLGGISLISYQAPLPGENRFSRSGVAYWFPPLMPSPFSGPFDEVVRVVALLKRGGQPARQHTDVRQLMPWPTAVMMPLLVALEAANWSFDEFRRGPLLRSGCDGAGEALEIVSRYMESAPPRVVDLVRPWLVRLLIPFCQAFIPLPIETYLEYHFTKVGDQTRMLVDHYIEFGTAHHLSTRALRELRHQVEEESTVNSGASGLGRPRF
ncbi:MAG: ketopantoate reductase [Proteobacteria bacterium]|nr:ketopantoate reductase [Pseudomonadota bacterium]